jgi:16S rRNA processing protein RimM
LSQEAAAGRAPEGQVVLAAVVGAHGINGEVRLKLFAESIESLARNANVQVGGRTLRLQGVKPGKNPVARFAEISDRTTAEALRGSLVTIARADLPPLESGEYYHADLIGLRCESAGSQFLGTVVAVENFGAGDILEIEQPDGKRAMVPFREGIADLAGEKIIADPEFLA